MKSLQYSALIIGLILLICSCGDDPLSTTIIDTTWKAFSVEQSDCDEVSEDFALRTATNNCIEWHSTTLCDYTYQFLANGLGFYQYTETSGVDRFDFEYTINDDINQLTICEDSNDCTIFNVDGNNLTVRGSDVDGCIVNAVFVKG